MELTMNNIIIVLFVGCSSLVFAQFNTLTPKELASNNALKQHQSFQNESVFKKEKEKKNIISKLFNSPSRIALKKEIDSLKAIMLGHKISGIKESKAGSNIVKDSLFRNDNKQIRTLENASTEKLVKKFDFIKEEVPVSKISMPLNKRMMVTSPFGWRIHPIFGATKLHNGVDFKADYENVYAVLDGVVIASGWDVGGGGNYIKIKHSDSFVTSYLHLSETYYKVGESVKAGFIIAKSGNTGNSTGAHLHFSVTENGKYINPIRFLNDLIKANNLIATYYEAGSNSNIQY